MKAVAAFCLCLLLGACAAYDGFTLKPGTSTEADVRRVMGQPAMEFALQDGSRKLVYPRGPLGNQTFMAVVGPDGVLRGIQGVLGEDNFYKIQPGMTRDDVLKLVGPPGDTMHFSGTDTTAWDYRFMDLWGYQAVFSAIFNRDGIVVSKFTRRLERDKGR